MAVCNSILFFASVFCICLKLYPCPKFVPSDPEYESLITCRLCLDLDVKLQTHLEQQLLAHCKHSERQRNTPVGSSVLTAPTRSLADRNRRLASNTNALLLPPSETLLYDLDRPINNRYSIESGLDSTTYWDPSILVEPCSALESNDLETSFEELNKENSSAHGAGNLRVNFEEETSDDSNPDAEPN